MIKQQHDGTDQKKVGVRENKTDRLSGAVLRAPSCTSDRLHRLVQAALMSVLLSDSSTPGLSLALTHALPGTSIPQPHLTITTQVIPNVSSAQPRQASLPGCAEGILNLNPSQTELIIYSLHHGISTAQIPPLSPLFPSLIGVPTMYPQPAQFRLHSLIISIF